MTLVNPLLATWDTSGVIRVFELSSGGNFVSIGTGGGRTHALNSTFTALGARETPLLSWDNEDTQLVVVRTPSFSSAVVEVFNPLVEAQGSLEISPGASNDGYLFADKMASDEYLIRLINPSVTRRVESKPLASIALQALQSGTTTPQKVGLAAAPNSLRVLDYHGSGASRYRLWGRSVTTENFSQKLTFSDFQGFAPSKFLWGADSRNILVWDPATARIQSWTYDPDQNTFSYVHELPVPASAGTIRRVALSPDRRMLAVSFKNGTVYKTQMYRRTGDYYLDLQVLDDIGELLGFTGDGVLLIDSSNRKCFELAGETWSAAHAKVSGIPAGISEQAVSAALTTQRAAGTPYKGAIAAIADESFDRNDLKITLLTSAASFNDNHTTISDVTNSGAYEVKSGHWPAGGYALQNVQTQQVDTYTSYKCDDVVHVVIDTALTARYAVIYQAGSGKPVSFLDFSSDRIVARNRQLILNFSLNEFLRIGK